MRLLGRFLSTPSHPSPGTKLDCESAAGHQGLDVVLCCVSGQQQGQNMGCLPLFSEKIGNDKDRRRRMWKEGFI
jgi:hypothetical protein